MVRTNDKSIIETLFLNSVTISHYLCIQHLWVPPVLGVRSLKRLVDGARRRPDEVTKELEDPLRLGSARRRDSTEFELV